jgi:hypothetical protein
MDLGIPFGRGSERLAMRLRDRLKLHDLPFERF